MPAVSKSDARYAAAARRFEIRRQHPIYGVLQGTQFRLFLDRLFPVRRNRIPDRLPHHPPMHSVLFGQTLYVLPGRVSAPDLFE
jgi:hypothetical protein